MRHSPQGRVWHSTVAPTGRDDAGVGDPAITRREAEVLRAVQQHLSNAEIAERLYVSERTVESHVSSLLRKLGAATRRELARAVDARRPNIPSPATAFVGRVEELVLVDAALARHRVVTLTGPGGVGKTRLALEAATRGWSRFSGGTYFVELAPVRDPDTVVGALAGALGIGEQPGIDLGATVATAVRNRPPSLIVLDNCEHLVDACAAVVESIVAAGDSARVLATSRAALGLAGERVIAVPPLSEAAAVELFRDRAELVATLSEADTAAVARVCRRLDHLPLAVELAAAQTRVVAPSELEDRLDDRFLRLPRRAGPASHHESMAAAVAWSYDRLPDVAQTVFARLAVFAGSFTIDAAEAVCPSADVGPGDVLAALGVLADRSMLVREVSAAGTARHRILEPLRLYALDRLDDPDGARRAHAAHYLDLARRAEAHVIGPDERAWIRRLRDDDNNLRAALDWARRHEPALAHQLAAALWPYWSNTTQHHAAGPILRGVIDGDSTGVDALTRAWTLTAAASLLAERGETEVGAAWADEASRVFRTAGEERGLAWATLAQAWTLDSGGELDRAEALLHVVLDYAARVHDDVLCGFALECRAHVASVRGDHRAARHWGERELAAWTKVASPTQLSWTYRNLAYAARAAGDLDDALTFADLALEGFEDEGAAAHVLNIVADVAKLQGRTVDAVRVYKEALAGFASIGDRRCQASSQKNLAQLAAQQGDHHAARRLFVDSLRVRHEFGDELGVAECLDGLAGVAAAAGRREHAVTLLGAAAARRDAAGAEPLSEDRALTEALLAALRGALTHSSFDGAWAEGAALDADGVIARAQLY